LDSNPAKSPAVACQFTMPRSYKGKRVVPEKPHPQPRPYWLPMHGEFPAFRYCRINAQPSKHHRY
jgi:hypothetical protein